MEAIKSLKRLFENTVSETGRMFLTADEQDTRRWKSDEMLKTVHISGFYLCSSSAFLCPLGCIHVHLRLNSSFFDFKASR